MYVWKQLTPSVPHHLDLGVAFGMTDTGTMRSSNEDNFLIDSQLGLVAVADGMGGHEAGEVASAEALKALAHFIRAHAADPGMSAMTVLRDAIAFTNQRMYNTNLLNRHGDGSGMGTTLTGLWQAAPDGPICIFHVGDSRLYRFRDGRLTQLTRDQTLYQQALDAGAVGDLPARNLLLQALGPSPEIAPDLQPQAVSPGDLYLLCSDGLYGASADLRIAAVLAAGAEGGLSACCSQLIEMAKQDGSRDNITAVLLRCRA